MNIKDISKMLESKALNGTVEAGEFSDFMKTLYDCVEQAQKVVLAVIPEEDFVRSCRMVKSAVLATAISQGNGFASYLADSKGELNGILDTYLLAMLGLLMQDEII